MVSYVKSPKVYLNVIPAFAVTSSKRGPGGGADAQPAEIMTTEARGRKAGTLTGTILSGTAAGSPQGLGGASFEMAYGRPHRSPCRGRRRTADLPRGQENTGASARTERSDAPNAQVIEWRVALAGRTVGASPGALSAEASQSPNPVGPGFP